jgi:hypothetical protein
MNCKRWAKMQCRQAPSSAAFPGVGSKDRPTEPSSTFRARSRAAAYLEYISFQVSKAGIKNAKTTEMQAVIKALEGLTFDSVIGPITIHTFDHQGTTPHWLVSAKWDPSLKLGVIADIDRLSTDRYRRPKRNSRIFSTIICRRPCNRGAA